MNGADVAVWTVGVLISGWGLWIGWDWWRRLMKLPLTRRELDQATCMVPGCDHAAHDGLTLRSVCHTRTPTWCEYQDGVLTVTCSLCHQVITQIAVKDAP